MPTRELKQIPDWLEHVGPGWQELLANLHRDLLKVHPDYGVLQVKEKFGGLRAYLHTTTAGQELARKAEEASYKICEECAKPGKMTRRGGYYQTLCGRCALIVGAKPLVSRGPRRRFG